MSEKSTDAFGRTWGRGKAGPAVERDGRSRRTYRLRPTLLIVVLGLLFLTLASVAGIAFVQVNRTIDQISDEQFDSIAEAAISRIKSVIDNVPTLLREYVALSRHGALPLNDPLDLGLIFAERLNQSPAVAWIGYGDAVTGRFIGAARRDPNKDRITIIVSDPAANGGMSVEFLFQPDGTLVPVESPETVPYRVLEKAWFKKAIELDGFGWLDPYVFTEGLLGVTAALPLTLPGQDSPSGVFHADFVIDGIANYLGSLKIADTGRVHLLTKTAEIVTLSRGWRDGDPALEALRTMVKEDRRPLFEKAVVEKLRLAGTDFRAMVEPVELANGPGWYVVVLAPEAEFAVHARRSVGLVAIGGILAFIAATLVAVVVSNRIAVPLRRIAEDLEQVAEFDLNHAPAPETFVREVATVGAATERMKSSLRSFQRYVPSELVRELLASGREAQLGGQRRRLTIHFSDIAGFTSIAETMQPEAVVEELVDYFELMRRIIRQHDGTIDKYMGDGILAFFNAPLDVPNHEIAACRAALIAQEALARDRERRRAEGRPELRARIGLETGEVLVGNIGTSDRFSYTVIGDSVNLAARLESLNKFYGTYLLGSADLKAATGNAFEWRRLDRAAVVGRTQGTEVHELLSLAGELPSERAAWRDAYEAALAAYFEWNFTEAAAGFRELAAAHPEDKAAVAMARRARKLARRPPPDGWTGVYSHAQK